MSKKQLIMEKSLELFAKQGFEATSVQQITDNCGISKGAFYLSFKSKDELILAIIDHFMMQIISDIDYLVKGTDEKKLLYKFYYAVFHSFQKHSDFTKVLMKEQSQRLNNEFIIKMQYYDKLLENSILVILDRLYGEDVEHIKYDLMYCMKGFMNTYSPLFLFYNIPLDLKLLAKSLVEKTNLLAKNTTIPFISQEQIEMMRNQINEETTKEQIITIIEQKAGDIEDLLEKESLVLLKQNLLEPEFPPAIVKGLLENIQKHPDCKWIAYLLRRYYKL